VRAFYKFLKAFLSYSEVSRSEPSKMPPALTPPQLPQQSNWNDKVYLVAVTRILVVVGVSYLLQSLYQLFRYSWSSDDNSLLSRKLLIDSVKSLRIDG